MADYNELMVKVYSFNGRVILEQANDDSDIDLVRLEARQVRPLIDALLKALAQVEVPE